MREASVAVSKGEFVITRRAVERLGDTLLRQWLILTAPQGANPFNASGGIVQHFGPYREGES